MAIEQQVIRLLGLESLEARSEISKHTWRLCSPNAQTLWIYLLTGPHTNDISGFFTAGEAGDDEVPF